MSKTIWASNSSIKTIQRTINMAWCPVCMETKEKSFRRRLMSAGEASSPLRSLPTICGSKTTITPSVQMFPGAKISETQPIKEELVPANDSILKSTLMTMQTRTASQPILTLQILNHSKVWNLSSRRKGTLTWRALTLQCRWRRTLTFWRRTSTIAHPQTKCKRSSWISTAETITKITRVAFSRGTAIVSYKMNSFLKLTRIKSICLHKLMEVKRASIR